MLPALIPLFSAYFSWTIPLLFHSNPISAPHNSIKLGVTEVRLVYKLTKFATENLFYEK
jgi:hypothetical protein